MNVLVYDGPGTSKASVQQMRTTLRSFLATSHDVLLASPKMLASEPWPPSTSLLVFPGGRDVPYHRALKGAANAKIRDWVARGGRYLGVCAGGYYASSKVDFQEGTDIAVVEDRELAFFPGTCRGTAFPGFVYDSEAGAKEADLSIERAAWRDHWTQAPSNVGVYYNGGGIFVEPEEHGAMVLARYSELPQRPAAAVHCRVGDGAAILWGVHPEHVARISPAAVRSPEALDDFRSRDAKRKALVRATLSMLGLEVPTEPTEPPPIKAQFLCSLDQRGLKRTADALEASSEGDGLLDDANDVFRIKRIKYDVDALALDASRLSIDDEPDDNGKPRKEVRELCLVEGGLPSTGLTPIFDLSRYFDALAAASSSPSTMGSPVIYGEVVTSTQTLLDKNPKLLRALPDGLVSVASHQVSGRGRGGNSWLSPPGCLQFSLVLRMPAKRASRVVFVQYLFGLAVVEAVRGTKGYEDVGIRLKWPNDIYAEVGAGETGRGKTGLEGYKKIGGILVNSSYAGGDFTLVVGCGINTTVPKPTTSLNELIATHNRRTGQDLAPFTPEDLLALIMARFGRMWDTFVSEGFDPFMDLYLDRWLHSDRLVKLEQTEETVRIVGITPDHGLLRTVKVHFDSRGDEVFGGPKGGFIDLQPDSNSFDMLASLLKVKR